MSTADFTEYMDPDRGFRVWNRREIYAGEDTGKYVPNPDDLVFDSDQGFMLVTSVDYTTGLSELTRWEAPSQPDENEDMNTLVGPGPGYPTESYRMFLDTSVTPHTLSPSRRLHWYGSEVDSYKVFKGSDINEETGEVISAFYDPSDNFLGTDIPVEKYDATDASEAIHVPSDGYTTSSLDDGELVTLVAYSDSGKVVEIAQLIVVNSAAIRQNDHSKKYVKTVGIDSPFISDADPQLIEFPVNVSVESLPMTAVVYYSDGSRSRHSLESAQFDLHGLRNYLATVEGQEARMVLAYQLGDDEVSYNLSPTANRRITRTYTARTLAPDNTYSVKLFVYPYWVDRDTGYRLEYWLYNLERDTFYNATPNVELGTNSNAFDPTDYGRTQTLTVAVDLNKVDGKFAKYRHVQTFQIALLGRGDDDGNRWEIWLEPDQDTAYGRGLFADVEYQSLSNWRLRLDNGFSSHETWLQNLYDPIEPLYDARTEDKAPRPTHFKVLFANNSYEYEISQWDEELIVDNDLDEGGVVYLQWIRRNADTDLQLGISGLSLRQLVEPGD